MTNTKTLVLNDKVLSELDNNTFVERVLKSANRTEEILQKGYNAVNNIGENFSISAENINVIGEKLTKIKIEKAKSLVNTKYHALIEKKFLETAKRGVKTIINVKSE